jgi:hypothetical protein
MGLNMHERKAVTGEYKPRYQKATKKEKKALLDEFTRLTGYHRKSAVRLPGVKPVKQVTVYTGGKAVKIKPEKKRPSNRKGKRVYTDEVIAALRMVREFFRFKCGKIPAPFMRRQTAYIAPWKGFGITDEIAEKLVKISPASIDRYLKKDKAVLRLKLKLPRFSCRWYRPEGKRHRLVYSSNGRRKGFLLPGASALPVSLPPRKS